MSAPREWILVDQVRTNKICGFILILRFAGFIQVTAPYQLNCATKNRLRANPSLWCLQNVFSSNYRPDAVIAPVRLILYE